MEQVAEERGRNFSWTDPDIVGALFLKLIEVRTMSRAVCQRGTLPAQDSSDLKWFLVGNCNLEQGLKLPKY